MGKIRTDPQFITALKPNRLKCDPFIVADMETVIVHNVHVPYAAGLLVVHPGDDVAAMDDLIYTSFTEDYQFIIPTFEERSIKMLVDFINRIAALGSPIDGVQTVYFHNFSRFDGILLMKFLVTHIYG
jgi:hypothetical protein